jgi:hypothetical protein
VSETTTATESTWLEVSSVLSLVLHDVKNKQHNIAPHVKIDFFILIPLSVAKDKKI